MPAPEDVLDNPAWHALAGAHAHLALRHGAAVRYPVDVSPLAALPTDPADEHWHDLAVLAGPGGVVSVPAPHLTVPARWQVVARYDCLQMLADGPAGHDGPVDATDPLGPGPGPAAAASDGASTVALGLPDAHDMLALVDLARPGPFAARTVTLGGYRGVRHDGTLVAMAGHRLAPPGHVEISAVATHPAHRSRGLAGRVVDAAAHAARRAGLRPFLHVLVDNTTAVRLYRRLGFVERRRIDFTVLRAPA